MPAFFVTATGTDIGKTFVTAGLIRHLRAQGLPVDARKPVMSGFDPATAADSDAGVLLRALGRSVSETELDRIAPWRYGAPLAPDLAAAREGHRLDVDKMIAHSNEAVARTAGTLLIEGVGGILVPLDETRTVLDWMTALGLPVLLVTGSYLGTISHTLTALAVLDAARLDVRAIVVCDSVGSTVALADTVDTLRRFGRGTRGTDVIAIPRLQRPDDPHPAFADLAALVVR
ncbi:MAG TPA: dethiobiotin synthase [Xanthobacteraceae bacterium]|nr:dethiobiotin synthase [Xanthobacteraceae bacterium]